MSKKVKKLEEAMFSKEQLMNSTKYSNRKDILKIMLEVEKEYTFEQVDAKISEFMKGKVK